MDENGGSFRLAFLKLIAFGLQLVHINTSDFPYDIQSKYKEYINTIGY